MNRDLTPNEFNSKLSKSILIDVRTETEYEMHHLENSRLINIQYPDSEQELLSLDKNQTILLYCRTGSRSSQVLNFLVEKGFPNVFHLSDGIVEWESQGFPTLQGM
jgi:phage shock protein E